MSNIIGNNLSRPAPLFVDFPPEIIENIFEVCLRSMPRFETSLKNTSRYYYEIYWDIAPRIFPSMSGITRLVISSLNIRFSNPSFKPTLINTYVTGWKKHHLQFLQSDTLGNRYFISPRQLCIFASDGRFNSIDLQNIGLQNIGLFDIIDCHRYGDHLLIVGTDGVACFCFNEEGIPEFKQKLSPFPPQERIKTSTLHQNKLFLHNGIRQRTTVMYDLTTQTPWTPATIPLGVECGRCSSLFSHGPNLFVVERSYGSMHYKLSPTIYNQSESSLVKDPAFSPFLIDDQPTLGDLMNNDNNKTGFDSKGRGGRFRSATCGRWFMDYERAHIQIIDLQSGTKLIKTKAGIPSPVKIQQDFFFLDESILFISWGQKTYQGKSYLAIHLPTNQNITHVLNWKSKSHASTVCFSIDHEKQTVHHFTHSLSKLSSGYQHLYHHQQYPFDWQDAPLVIEDVPAAQDPPPSEEPQQIQDLPTDIGQIIEIEEKILSEKEMPPSASQRREKGKPHEAEAITAKQDTLPPEELQQSLKTEPTSLAVPRPTTEKPSRGMSISTIALLAIATAAVIAITLVGILAAIGNQTWAPEALKHFAHQFGPNYAAYIYIATTPAYLIILGVGYLVKKQCS